MTRARLALLALLLAAAALAWSPLAGAEDPAPAEPEEAEPGDAPPAEQDPNADELESEIPAPNPASDEEAEEALAIFKEAFKAKGLRGEDKVDQKIFALKTLATVQHPKVVEALYKETRNRDVDVRTEAVLKLGLQTAWPGRAGVKILQAMKRNGDDNTFLMAALESIESLDYLGAEDTLKALMRHKDYSVTKRALETIGALGDVRMIEDVFKLLKALKLEKGAKWDGVDVTYDTGTAGDHDQKMAEKIGKAKEAANKSKGKKSRRDQRDLGPVVLSVMKDLTGQEFTGSIGARKWMDANEDLLKDQQKDLEKREKTQRDE